MNASTQPKTPQPTSPLRKKKKKKTTWNKTILLWAVLGVAVTGLAGFGVKGWLAGRRAQQALTAGEAAFANKNYEVAAAQLGIYTTTETGKNDSERTFKQAEALSHRTAFPPRNTGDKPNYIVELIVIGHAYANDKPKTNKAIQERYVQLALELFRFPWTWADNDLRRQADEFNDNLEEVGSILLKSDPNSVIAAEGFAVGLRQKMLKQESTSSPPTQKDWNESGARLDELLAKHPNDSVVNGARLMVLDRQLDAYRRTGQKVTTDLADPDLAKGIKWLTEYWDKLGVALRDDNSAESKSMNTQERGTMLEVAAQAYDMSARVFSDRTDPKILEARRAVYDCYNKAAIVIQPNDLDFDVLLIHHALVMRGNYQDDVRAANSLKRVVDAHKKSIKARLDLVDLLRKMNQPEMALKTLNEDELVADETYVDAAGYMFLALRPQAIVRRAELNAILYPTKPQEERETIRRQIDDDRKVAVAALPDGDRNPRVRLVDVAIKRFIDGDDTKAQEMLNDLLNDVPNENLTLFEEVCTQFVSVSADKLGQTGTARHKLEDLMTQKPNDVYLVLADIGLLLREREYTAAQKLLEPMVIRAKGQSPQITLLWVMAHKDDAATQATLIEQMPEATPEDRLAKLACALEANQPKFYTPLMEAVYKDNPTQQMLIRGMFTMQANNQSEEAVKFAQRGMTEHPDVAAWKQMYERLTVKDWAKQQIDAVGNGDNPYAAAMVNASKALNDDKDARKALDFFEKAIALDPDCKNGVTPELYAWQIYLQLRDFDKAYKMVDVFAKLNSDGANGRLYKVKTLVAEGKNDEAVNLARDVQKELNTYEKAWVTLGLAQAANGQNTDALRSFEKALSDAPADPEALMGAINATEQLGDTAALKDKIQTALEKQPGVKVFIEKWIDFQQANGDLKTLIGDGGIDKGLVQRREQAVSDAPKDPDASLKLGLLYFRVAQLMALANNDAGSKEWINKAIKQRSDAMALFPGDIRFLSDYADWSLRFKQDFDSGLKAIVAAEATPAMQGNTQLQMLKAEYFLRAGKPTEAMAVLDLILAQNPEMVQAMQFKVQALLGQNRLDDALALLDVTKPGLREMRVELLMSLAPPRDADALGAVDQILTQKDVDTVKWQSIRGQLMMRLKRYAEAKTIASNLLAADATNAGARWLRAIAEDKVAESDRRSPDFGAMVADLAAVQSAQPHNVTARLKLAEVYSRIGKEAEAQAQIEQTYNDNKSSRDAALGLVDYYLKMGHLNEARAITDEIHSNVILFSDPQVLVRTSTVLVATGDPQGGYADAKKAVDLAPNSILTLQNLLTISAHVKPDEAIKLATSILAQDQYKDAWWAMKARGSALAIGGKKAEAQAEFARAFQIAYSQGQEGGAREIVQAENDYLGLDIAFAQISDLAEKEFKWRILAVEMLSASGDLPRARRLVEMNIQTAANLGSDVADQVIIYHQAAQFYLAENPPEPQKSVDCYQKLIDLGGGDKMSYNNFAYALTLLNTPEALTKATEFGKKAYDIALAGGFGNRKEDPFVLDTYGWCLVLAGRTDDGMQILSKGLEIDTIPELYYHLAEGHLKRNFKDSAIEMANNGLDKIAERIKNREPVDPLLKGRLEDVLRRAKE